MTDRAKLIEELREFHSNSPILRRTVDLLRRAAAQIEADGRLEAEIERLKAVLIEVEKALALVEQTPPRDPLYQARVEELGQNIGYGAIMASAERAWAEKLKTTGISGGEFVAGPCRVTVDRILKVVRAAIAGGKGET